MLRVAELWRYPVKSLGGERLESTRIGELGIPGDRAFGIVDVASGKVLTARREPRLLFATATWHDGEVEIEADGQRLDDDAALSRWLDRPVRLVRAGPVGGIYENPEDIDNEADWQSWRGPGDAWHDNGRIRLSLVSMDTLGDWAPQRFRANVLLDDGRGEDALVGREVALGSARLKVTQRIHRCIMVARPQPDLTADLDILRAINRERDGCLAVGALVTRSGNVEAGDRLRLGE